MKNRKSDLRLGTLQPINWREVSYLAYGHDNKWLGEILIRLVYAGSVDADYELQHIGDTLHYFMVNTPCWKLADPVKLGLLWKKNR